MITDQIADFLTRVRNAANAGHQTISFPSSKAVKTVAEVLKEEGFLDAIEEGVDSRGHAELRVVIRFVDGGPVLRELKRLSSPGRRVYAKRDDVPRFRGGLGTVVVSTSKGMMTDREARKNGLGGELVCAVF